MRAIRGSTTGPATALALLALFVALSGTAISLPGRNVVSAGDIKPNAVNGKHVASNSLNAKDIAEQSLNAQLLTGVTTKTIQWRGGTDDGPQTILNFRGLRLEAECNFVQGVGTEIDLVVDSTRVQGQVVVTGVRDLIDGDQPLAFSRHALGTAPVRITTRAANLDIVYRALPKTRVVAVQLALDPFPVFCDGYGIAEGAGLDD